MRGFTLSVVLGMAMVVLAGCAMVPMTPSAYRLTPDGAKEFVLTMRAGDFSPKYLVVKQGDRVRIVLYSHYQFAFFTLNQFRISRMVSHDAPEVVEFVATERGWFDFDCYGFYPYYAQLNVISDVGGGKGADQQRLYGRLYVL